MFIFTFSYFISSFIAGSSQFYDNFGLKLWTTKNSGYFKHSQNKKSIKITWILGEVKILSTDVSYFITICTYLTRVR